MAKFQIEKNPKKRFFDLKIDRTTLTLDDYEEAADALIRNAKEYFLFTQTSHLNKCLCTLKIQ